MNDVSRSSRTSEEWRRRSCLKHLGLREQEIAGIVFKLAETREEREQAFRLLHDVYVRRGLIDPCPRGLKMSVYSFLPTTAILIGIRDGVVLSTMSLVEDSPLGLPLDELYDQEIASLRRRRRRLAEIGALAVENSARARGLTLMMNSLLMRWALFYRRLDDLLLTVHPKSADLYRTLYLCEPLGGERRYEKLRGAPAVLLRMDLRGWIARLRGAFDSDWPQRQEHRALNFYRFLLLDFHPNVSLPAAPGPTGVAEPPPWNPFEIAEFLSSGEPRTEIVSRAPVTIFCARDRIAGDARTVVESANSTERLQIVENTSGKSAPAPTARKKVLFVGEATTLTSVARPLALASALDPDSYDVSFACDPRFQRLYPNLPFRTRAIQSISSEQFLRALATSSPIYDAETLRRYVREDLEVFGEMSPDVVVGCFRLSLAISARLAGVPYLAITNACWSPYLTEPLPFVNPVLNSVGPNSLLTAVRPLALAYHSLPFNKVCRESGLRPVGLDVRRVFTEADQALYSDVPELFPTSDLPTHHHYLGPIEWSPALEPPEWWNQLPSDRPEVYVTLGSSGRGELLAPILEALADLPVAVIASTAGRRLPDALPANAFAAEFLPGRKAAARARLVICAGGSTAYQAIAVGVPVIGVAGNMHQTWTMQAIQRAGAGELLRAADFDPEALRAAVRRMLAESSYSEAALALAGIVCRYDPGRRLEEVLGNVLSSSSAVA
jgi:UDP:flavonoid glycosyltransferase YjiC (YdhE family)